MTEHGPKITMHSKVKALELLGKHFSLLGDRVRVDNPEDRAVDRRGAARVRVHAWRVPRAAASVKADP